MKALQRAVPKATDEQLAYGIPLFLDQIIKTLQLERSTEPLRSRSVSGPAGGGVSGPSEIGTAARHHGHELLQHGYTIDRVVHDYGDLCQSITDLAFEQRMAIQVDEFRTVNRCLDNAIADAVTEYAYERDQLIADSNTEALNERLGIFAHELRNLLTTATHAVSAIRTGQVGLSGPTGAVLDRCLIRLRSLVDRSLADVRLGAPMPPRSRLISLAGLIADIEVSASLEARAQGCTLRVAPVDARLAVDADRDMLIAAIGNLLQNAFRFTQYRSEVGLSAYAKAEHILIDVEDCCGGLPVDVLDGAVHAAPESGAVQAGLGLSICRRSVEANHGSLRVRNLPGTGCVFTIDLPRHLLSETFYRS